MSRTLLEHAFDHEAARPTAIYLTQPLGGGPVRDYTWRETLDEARRMAAHLQTLGLAPGDRVGLLSKNCAHFIMAELAIWMAGYATVAIFPTEGAGTVRFVLEHSEARVMFVGKLDAWPTQAPGVPDGVRLIVLPLAPPVAGAEAWDEVTARTAPLAGRPARDPHDLAMIVYTSGSTGEPKGAMHEFGALGDVAERIQALYGYGADERILSYLPMAHVYERVYCEALSLVAGSRVFFAESLDTFVKDLQRARPTVFLSVPRLWMKFQQGVFAKVPPKKLALLLSIPVVGRRVGRKVLAGLGLDSVRIAASGSAPIPAELIAWYRRLGLTLLEGYGMTEDLGYSHTSRVDRHRPGYVGVPYPGVDVKLSEEGEIWVRSPGRLRGYFKRPDLDAEAITPDGYFRTGDLGARAEDGMLKVTGRLKELFKTAKGKYVAPAPIENRLNEHPLIELACVSGVGMPAAYALVVLAEDVRPTVGDAAVRARIEAALAAHLAVVNAAIADYEQLRMIVIAAKPWTIEGGELTPTLKIKRARIEADVAARVEGWFDQPGKVLWA